MMTNKKTNDAKQKAVERLKEKLMTNRYYIMEYNGEVYFFDSEHITKDEVKKKFEFYDYVAFQDSLEVSKVLDLLNILTHENKTLKEYNKFLKCEQKFLTEANSVLQQRQNVGIQSDTMQKLKQKIKDLKNIIDFLSKELSKIENTISEDYDIFTVIKIKNENIKLKEKNKVLNKELDAYKPVVFKDIQSDGEIILYLKTDQGDEATILHSIISQSECMYCYHCFRDDNYEDNLLDNTDAVKLLNEQEKIDEVIKLLDDGYDMCISKKKALSILKDIRRGGVNG